MLHTRCWECRNIARKGYMKKMKLNGSPVLFLGISFLLVFSYFGIVLCLHGLILACFLLCAFSVVLCCAGSVFALVKVVRTCGLVTVVFASAVVIVSMVIVVYCDGMEFFSAVGCWFRFMDKSDRLWKISCNYAFLCGIGSYHFRLAVNGFVKV